MPAPQPVSVNGVVIARDAIAREVQNHPADKPIVSWQSAARALAIRELLLQEARRLGMAPSPQSDDSGRRETDDEALIRALIEQEVTTPEPDVDACRRYYDQNRKRFHSAAIYEASHILFAARRDDTEAFARARHDAEAALAVIKREPHRFEEFARQHSACPSAAQGGNLGQITAGQITAEFETALTQLQPGEMSAEPVATRYGFHIIRLDRRIDGCEQPFEAVSERIADYLRASVTQRAIAQFIARLVSRADITGVSLADAQTHRVN
jgi:peptidyl-prolyl cis-trans isomerase C